MAAVVMRARDRLAGSSQAAVSPRGYVRSAAILLPSYVYNSIAILLESADRGNDPRTADAAAADRGHCSLITICLSSFIFRRSTRAIT